MVSLCRSSQTRRTIVKSFSSVRVSRRSASAVFGMDYCLAPPLWCSRISICVDLRLSNLRG